MTESRAGTRRAHPREIPTPDLGGGRGRLSDWVTQRWVQHTGRRVRWVDHPWLEAPVGDVEVIGADFFERFASRQGLVVRRDGASRGLLARFDDLAGPRCTVDRIDHEIRRFYERTSEYGLDAWSEWCGLYRPFGGLLAALFSRRLQQLNLPLSPLDSRLGITSEVLRLETPEGRALGSAWVRTNVATGAAIYVGSYSVARVPGREGGCVKVAFPLPHGYALVVMWPESHPDGSLTLHSSGRGFGDAGFYFYVEAAPREGWARYVGSMVERIHVFRDPRAVLRADHELRIWGGTFLRLHYRISKTGPGDRAAGEPA
jgi:hypothetical protein